MTNTIGTSSVLRQVKKYVKAEFKNIKRPSLVHTYKNTRKVITTAIKISKQYRLNDTDHFVLLTSCWFYGLGFLKDYKKQAQASVEEMEKFFKTQQVEKEVLLQIKKTILATTVSQRPNNTLQMILCDAVTVYMGKKKFNHISRKLRKQEEADTGVLIPKTEWRKRMINLLSSHQFFTLYAQQKWDKRKEKNLKALTQKASRKD